MVQQKYLLLNRKEQEYQLFNKINEELPVLQSLESALMLSKSSISNFSLLLKHCADVVLLDDVYIGDEERLKEGLWELAQSQLEVFEKHEPVVKDIRSSVSQIAVVKERMNKLKEMMKQFENMQEELDTLEVMEKSFAIQLIQQTRSPISIFAE